MRKKKEINTKKLEAMYNAEKSLAQLNNQFILKVGALVFSAIIVVLLLSLLFVPIDISGQYKCASDHIGIDIEAYNNIQQSKCEYTEYNCFKEEMQLEHIKLKDIDGLNCNGYIDVQMPLFLAAFMDG